MDRYEEVCLYLARFLHARLQRNEIVTVADEQAAQSGFAVEFRLKATRDGERHVLFVSAAAALGARILAAMTCVDGDDERARGAPRALSRRRARPSRCASVLSRTASSCGFRTRFGTVRDRRRSVSGGRCRLSAASCCSLALRHQRHQRIGRRERIDVHHQTVTVVADRFEAEDLRLRFALQVEHDAQHAGFETAHPHRLDVGIVARDLRRRDRRALGLPPRLRGRARAGRGSLSSSGCA